jgi:hypothetical protein
MCVVSDFRSSAAQRERRRLDHVAEAPATDEQQEPRSAAPQSLLLLGANDSRPAAGAVGIPRAANKSPLSQLRIFDSDAERPVEGAALRASSSRAVRAQSCAAEPPRTTPPNRLGPAEGVDRRRTCALRPKGMEGLRWRFGTVWEPAPPKRHLLPQQAICRQMPRRRPESNRCRRLCRPLRSHSATSP